MITELLALIASYSGIFIGKYLSKAAKEEVEAGRKNLQILKISLSVIIFLLFLVMTPFSLLFKITLYALIIILVIIWRRFREKTSKPASDLYVFGVLFGLNPTFLMSVLIFLYGFPSGSLIKGSYVKVLKKTWIYLLLGVVALIVRNYFLS